MAIRGVILLFIIVCTACQSGKIPCPEIKMAKLKATKAHKKNRFALPPSTVFAATKNTTEKSTTRREVNLNRIKASKTTGKEMLEHYGTVEEWDCPNPNGKRRYSKVAKENIRKNEKRMKDHLKTRNPSDTAVFSFPRNID